ncbi:ankyrin repeat domain-containing protein [Marinomonas sp.]|uniref:ankyrin repeat domain-containing protein n=1 Tax=Marinomonas sp. TaxID=1904862 RepID=UPI003BAAF4B3
MDKTLQQYKVFKVIGFLLCLLLTQVAKASSAETFDWHKQNKYGNTLLHLIYSGNAWQDKSNEDKVTLLREAFDAGEIDPNIRNANGETAAHLAMTLIFDKSRKTGDLYYSSDFFKVLLQQPNLNPNIKDYNYRQTPLMDLIINSPDNGYNNIFVAKHYPRTLEIFNYFTTHTGLVLNYTNNIHQTIEMALEQQASRFFGETEENIEDFKSKIQSKNLKLQLSDKFDEDESYRLWSTFYNMNSGLDLGYLKSYKNYIIQYINKGADPDYLEQGYTVLNILANSTSRSYGVDYESNDQLRTQLAQLIIDNGADINTFATDGNTPLHNSIRSSNLYFIKMLFSQPNLDYNRQDSKGNTPVMAFFRYYWRSDDFKEVTELLYSQKNKFDLNIRNYSGETGLDILDNIIDSRNRDFLGKWIDE